MSYPCSDGSKCPFPELQRLCQQVNPVALQRCANQGPEIFTGFIDDLKTAANTTGIIDIFPADCVFSKKTFGFGNGEGYMSSRDRGIVDELTEATEPLR